MNHSLTIGRALAGAVVATVLFALAPASASALTADAETVSASASPSVVRPDGVVTFTVVVRNNGPDAFPGPPPNDTLRWSAEGHSRFSSLSVSSTHPKAVCSMPPVTAVPTCDIPLAVGESATITLVDRVTSPGSETVHREFHSSAIGANQGPGGEANDTRTVPITILPASGSVLPPDITKPVVGGLGISDSTLTPGQTAKFTFASSEAGMASLIFAKHVKGLKLRSKGKLRCLAETRSRLAKLRRSLAKKARGKQLATALKRRRCKTYKTIGSIRRVVSAGRNEIAFSGRIAGRRLSAGSYRAQLTVVDAARNVSRTETVKFKVVAKKKKKTKR